MGKRRVEQDYHDVALKKNIKWVGAFPDTTHHKTLWECEKAHRWMACYHDIKKGNGSGCPMCGPRGTKTEDDYTLLATNRGFEWVGTFPKTTTHKTIWRCSAGHLWDATYHHIRVGKGCPTCYKIKTVITDQQYTALAEKRGFLWIGSRPKRTDEKTKWRCEHGHKWDAAYQNIKSGTGCPTCAKYINGVRVSSIQLHLAALLGGEVNYRCGRFYIDIAFPETRVGVEYSCWYWHGNRIQKDEERLSQLLSCGWRIVTIKTGNIVPSVQEIQVAIDELDHSQTFIIQTKDWGVGPCRV